MDGTIVNTLDSIACYGNQALKTVLSLPPIPVNAYRYMVGNGRDVLIERILQKAGVTDTGKIALQVGEEYDRLYESSPLHLVTAYPGIEALLKNLKLAGIKLAVLSNKPDNMTTYIADMFFPGIFDIVQGQKPGVPKKPDPTALNAIISHFQAEKAAVLYCGDSGVDMQTGINAGVFTVGVTWGFRDKTELLENGCSATADTAAELQALIMS